MALRVFDIQAQGQRSNLLRAPNVPSQKHDMQPNRQEVLQQNKPRLLLVRF
jgi:hypothetical protein